MKLNYEIFVDNDIKQCVDYSFGFNSFYEQVDHLKNIIDSGKINMCSFIERTDTTIEEDAEIVEDVLEEPKEKEPENRKKHKKQKFNTSDKSNKSTTSNKSEKSATSNKSNDTDYSHAKSTSKNVTKFKNLYYPPHETPVKNNVIIDKKIIITGPNAAGKTTVIKSTLMNIILSQQIGYGFYESAKVKPYDYLHCYLNIPDTSGRDSLFQAECRRCKEILDTIKENGKTDTHLCVFDELYSGTNPDEAELSSVAFMEYLIKMKNIKCILTTHFVKICSILETRGNIKNYYMDTTITENNDFKYSFKLLKGISEVKGGIKVLKDMNYPKEIIEETENENSLPYFSLQRISEKHLPCYIYGTHLMTTVIINHSL
jgi:hypothetical protein